MIFFLFFLMFSIIAVYFCVYSTRWLYVLLNITYMRQRHEKRTILLLLYSLEHFHFSMQTLYELKNVPVYTRRVTSNGKAKACSFFFWFISRQVIIMILCWKNEELLFYLYKTQANTIHFPERKKSFCVLDMAI